MQICRTAVAACLGLVLLMVSAPAQAQYRITNLVSNQVHQAPTIDPLLANAWGLARGATGLGGSVITTRAGRPSIRQTERK